MLRQLMRKLSSQHLPDCKGLTMRYFSMQQNLPSNISRMVPTSFLTSTLPKISPTVHNNIGGQEIVDIWKMPEYKPPTIILPFIKDNNPLSIENPELPKIEKQAARMIVIRRRKMKKHKLRKLRKVRKFEYRRMALKRKTQKEKDFRMKLMTQMKEAEKFDAKSYVENLIRIAKEEIVEPPKSYPGFKRNPLLYDEKGNRILLNQHLYGKK